MQHVKFRQRDVRASEKMTWAAVLSMILEAHGGRMKSAELEGEMSKHPKGKANNHLAEKLRQELQRHPRMFRRDGADICLARPA